MVVSVAPDDADASNIGHPVETRSAGAAHDPLIHVLPHHSGGGGLSPVPLAAPPAETLWIHVNGPIVSRHFETLAELETAVARQHVAVGADRDRVTGEAGLRWGRSGLSELIRRSWYGLQPISSPGLSGSPVVPRMAFAKVAVALAPEKFSSHGAQGP